MLTFKVSSDKRIEKPYHITYTSTTYVQTACRQSTATRGYHNTHGGQHRHNTASISHNKKAWSRLLAATKLLDREGGGGRGRRRRGRGRRRGRQRVFACLSNSHRQAVAFRELRREPGIRVRNSITLRQSDLASVYSALLFPQMPPVQDDSTRQQGQR